MAFPIFQPTVCGASQILISTPLWLWRKTLLWSPRIPNTRRRPFCLRQPGLCGIDLRNLWNSSRLTSWLCSPTRIIPKFWILSRKWIKPFGQPPRQPPTPLPRRHVLALRTPVYFAIFVEFLATPLRSVLRSVGVQLGAGSFLTSEPPVLGTILTPSDL